MDIRDVIIIGAGPAGYTAAIYLGRARLSPLMLAGESAGGQLMYTTEVENFPGFIDGIMGPNLMDSMRKQAERFGAEIKNVNVTKVDLSSDVKKVFVGDTEYQARAVIISTGASAKMLGIGEERLLGRGVSSCAVCDAAFFREKRVFVVGGGDAAVEDAMALTKFAREVNLVHRRDSLRASKIMQERLLAEPKVKVWWDSEVVAFEGENKLAGISVKNLKTGEEKKEEADGLFLAIGHTPTTWMFNGEIEFDDHGYILTQVTEKREKSGHEMWLSGMPTQTNKKGVFACGDVVDFRYRQAITAAGMGCQAALDCEKYLTGSFSAW
jgi:thioredoxin reductase (NADPH)